MNSRINLQEVSLPFSSIDRQKIEVQISEPNTSSDGGVVLLREVEKQTGYIETFSNSLIDSRNQSYVKHSFLELSKQRIFQIATGHEDCNDCDFLKDDPLFQISSKEKLGSLLSSQPTMSRFENSISRPNLLRASYAICDNFLNGFAKEPAVIIIDMDPTENRVYGDQQLALFNGFADDYCFMPFHVYDGITGQLITTVLRPGKTPSGTEIKTVLKRIVNRIRSRFSNTKLIFRADSHHCRTEVLTYLDEHEIGYIIGLSKKYLPRDICGNIGKRALMLSKLKFKKVRLFHSFKHSVSSWDRQRRVICRAEGNGSEADLRYIVTNLTDKTQFLYEKVYCDRANAELRIKDSKSGLHSDRTSCHGKEANQFRLLLNAVAYQIMHAFRANILKGTQWAKCTFKTIQLRVLKTSARLEVKKTFIRLHMPKSCTAKQVFNRFAKISQCLNKT